MISAICEAAAARRLGRIGILGTRTVMEARLYGSLPKIELIAPRGAMRDEVHMAYSSMAAAGVVTDAQRAVFDTAVHQLLVEGQVEAIMLGGTDLALVDSEADAPGPIVNCAGIHAQAIADLALT